MKDIVKSDPALLQKHQQEQAFLQKQREHSGNNSTNNSSSSENFNPHLTIGQTFSSPVCQTCIEVLETPIPPKPKNLPDSDTEPSINSNLKSSCLAVLGCVAFALRDCVSVAIFPTLPSILSLPNQQQQVHRLIQFLQEQYIYRNTNQQNQIRFITQFLLPSLKTSWIEVVGAVLSQKDSTPRIRWGAARTLVSPQN